MSKKPDHASRQQLHRTVSARPSGTNDYVPENHGQRRRRKNNTNVILFMIVALFLACHFIRFFGFYYWDSMLDFADQCSDIFNNVTTACNETNGNATLLISHAEAKYPQWLWFINPVGNFLLLLNSSLNFIIYVLAGTRFRKTFFRKISCLCPHRPDQSAGVNEANDFATVGYSPNPTRGNSKFI